MKTLFTFIIIIIVTASCNDTTQGQYIYNWTFYQTIHYYKGGAFNDKNYIHYYEFDIIRLTINQASQIEESLNYEIHQADGSKIIIKTNAKRY